MKKSSIEGRSLNPHWVGDEPCRDYKIGNIILKSVPDWFVKRCTKFDSPYGLAIGNVDEFCKETKLSITFKHDLWRVEE